MTLLERLRRARMRLGVAVLSAAVAWAVAAVALVGIIAALVARLAPTASLVGRVMPVAAAAGLVALVRTLWRRRALRSIEAVALWIEERRPELQYALVTAADPRVIARGTSPALDVLASAAQIELEVARATRPLVARALGAAAIAVTAWLALRQAGLTLDRSGTSSNGTLQAADIPNRLVPLSARVDPPAYARLPRVDLADPSSIEGLPGSTVTLIGRGPPVGVTLLVGGDTLAAAPEGGGWSRDFRMPAAADVATLRDRAYRRLVVLVARPDSAPTVVLAAPAHDTTYQTVPSKPVALEARATDDIGLATGHFEYLISSGDGEHFTTVTRTGPRQAFGPGRAGTIRAAIRLDTLRLTPGSVVNIRAVVLDANDVTGPGKGVSETRTLRLAERLDTTNVAAAPPDQIDSMLVSQRLLNMRTDTLLRTRGRLTRAAVADRSMSYSNVQESIRLRVVAVVALLEDDGVGGTAPTDVSRLLRGAATEMGTARIDLATAAPDRAMPHMRRALAVLDQVRNAHRYYLRGRMPPVLVDVERVRMQGGGTPAPAPRSPRERVTDVDILLAERVERAARLYPSSPEAALDSLTFVRVAAIAARPALADALARALDRIRAGGALAPSLVPVRRLLTVPAAPVPGSAEWLGTVAP